MLKNNLIGISGKMQSGKDTVATLIQNYIDRESPYIIKKFADKLKDITCILIGCNREQLEDSSFKESPLGEEWNKYKVGQIIYNNKEELLNSGYTLNDAEIIHLTPRKLLQLIGTDCGRKIIHPDIWVNATFCNYTPSQKWILSDVRFPNEVKAIKDRGGIVIKVIRNDLSDFYIIEQAVKQAHKELCIRHSIDENNDSLLWDGDCYKENYQKEFDELYDIYIDLYKPHESETALDSYTDWDYVIYNNGSLEDLNEKIRKIIL